MELKKNALNGFAAGAQRTQRTVFNIPLTINLDPFPESLDRGSQGKRYGSYGW